MAHASAERFCHVGDVDLCFQTFGEPEDPTVLLIMGLGTQMLAWHEDFCELLVQRGFHVVRFDNRDCGRSTHLDQFPPPTVTELLTRHIRHPAYTLDDLARDAAGLLDHLEVDAAHVVGASMGGMVAQTLAARSPSRVRSLVSIMSNTGSRLHGQPAPRVLPLLLRHPPSDKDAYIEQMVRVFGIVGSPGYERDEAGLRSLLALSHDRGTSFSGTARQLAAIIASGNRTASLRTIRAPTLVIHGAADRLVSPSGGRATARAIPGAHLLLLAGMGHDLPRQLWPVLVRAIALNATRDAERSTLTAASAAGRTGGTPRSPRTT
jgi:pimeloyl-ACP methyl ester carboxylesterase